MSGGKTDSEFSPSVTRVVSLPFQITFPTLPATSPIWPRPTQARLRPLPPPSPIFHPRPAQLGGLGETSSSLVLHQPLLFQEFFLNRHTTHVFWSYCPQLSRFNRKLNATLGHSHLYTSPPRTPCCPPLPPVGRTDPGTDLFLPWVRSAPVSRHSVFDRGAPVVGHTMQTISCVSLEFPSAF